MERKKFLPREWLIGKRNEEGGGGERKIYSRISLPTLSLPTVPKSNMAALQTITSSLR